MQDFSPSVFHPVVCWYRHKERQTMKIITALVLTLLCAVGVAAQTPVFSDGGFDREMKEIQEKKKKRAAYEQATRNRVVDGKHYDILKSELWSQIFSAKVDSVSKAGIVGSVQKFNRALGDHVHDHYILVKHHPLESSVVSGEYLEPFRAMKVGRTQINGDMVAIYDCGVTPPVTPTAVKVLTPDQITAKNAAAAQKRTEQRAAELKFHQALAAKGDAYGQLRMGERYLKGDGVDEDPVKARELLAKAAAQGNETAKALLGKLENQKAPQ